MENYSILIVALDCHFSHMTRFICNLKRENSQAKISLFTDKGNGEIPSEIIDIVDDIFFHKLSKGEGTIGIIKKILSLRKHFKELSKSHTFDVVDIHFPHYYMTATMYYIRKMTHNIVVSPWGSDILRINGVLFKVLLKGVIAKCDYITTACDGNIGKRIIDNLSGSQNKFYPQSFGSETIDYINEHLEELKTYSSKQFFGLEGKYVITCGYNAFRAQNHEKIIEAITRIRTQLPKGFVLLFPVSYGAYDKDKYILELKKKCREEHLDAVFVDKYLPVPEISMLRKATDLFIHVQSTDASCSTLKEYVLCDKKIVHGGWIQYPMLDKYKPLCYHIVSDFSALENVILKAVNSEQIAFPQAALDYIKSAGWVTRRKGWNEMFIKITK